MNNKLKQVIESVIDKINEEYKDKIAERVFPMDKDGNIVKRETDDQGNPVLEFYVSRDSTQKVIKVLYKLNEPYAGTNTNYLIVKSVSTKDWDSKTVEFTSEVYLSDPIGSYSERLSDNYAEDPDKVIEGMGYKIVGESKEVFESLNRFFTLDRIKRSESYLMLKERVKKSLILENLKQKISNFSYLYLSENKIISEDIFFIDFEPFSDKFKKFSSKMVNSHFKNEIGVIELSNLKFKSQKLDGVLTPKAYFIWGLDNPDEYYQDFVKFERYFKEIKAYLYQIALEFGFK